MITPASFSDQEIDWLRRVMNFRAFEQFRKQFPGGILPEQFNAEETEQLKQLNSVHEIQPPSASADSDDEWEKIVARLGLNFEERFVLCLTLVQYLKPSLLDVLAVNDPATGRVYSKHGGFIHAVSRCFVPTAETALFLLDCKTIRERRAVLAMFSDSHSFRKFQILHLKKSGTGEPESSAQLQAYGELLDLVQFGFVRPPDFGNDFPAKRITTSMDWEDLVLSPMTLRQVEEVKVWLKHGASLHEELGMHKRLKPGYRALFYGPPGTGKTLTACLLGKFLDRPVFRIDLSMVVNKYIGETEKNLAKIFDKAEHANWILFFDEADALFGKRTSSNSSNDRYANQEVSYLLQRIEDFPGIVILASNMKSNIDDAFARRFQSMVHFASPKGDERRRLWKNAFSSKLQFSAEVDIVKLADKYDLSGGHITNVVAWCSLMALDRGDYLVTEQLLREGIARELAKEGRTL